jgi:type II secretory pathway component PulF
VSKKLSSSYEREVDYSLGNLAKWIEPLAILLA